MFGLLVPFVFGILVGQEVQEIPRIRPVFEKGLKQLALYMKNISEEADKQEQKKLK